MEPIKIEIPHTEQTTAGSITLSGVPDAFINLSIKGGFGGGPLKALNPGDAKALRDALITIYPLPAIAAEPSEYTTRHMFGRWEIVHEVPTTDIAVVGYADDEDSATLIAKALNESEGL